MESIFLFRFSFSSTADSSSFKEPQAFTPITMDNINTLSNIFCDIWIFQFLFFIEHGIIIFFKLNQCNVNII